MFDIRYNDGSLALGAYQAALGAVGVLVFLFLVWRALRLIAKAEPTGAQWTKRDLVVQAFWPAAAWGGVVLCGAVIFSTMQAYGPRVALPKTELTISKDADNGGEVKSLVPQVTSDAERVEQQRALERETKSRVNLE